MFDFLPIPPTLRIPPSQHPNDIKFNYAMVSYAWQGPFLGFSSQLHNNFCCDDKNLLGKKQDLTRDKLDLYGKEPAFANTCLYTFKIPPPWKTPNFHLNKICESLIYLLAETHHLFLQTKHNKLSGNFKRMSDYSSGKFVFLFWWKLLNSMQSELICCILNKPSPL